MVLMRMMLSGRRSSEIRIWFSWSYTDFLGTLSTIEKQKVWNGPTRAKHTPTNIYEEHVQRDIASVICLPALWVASLGSTRSPCCWSCHFGPWSSVCLSWRCCEDASAACSPFYWGRDKRQGAWTHDRARKLMNYTKMLTKQFKETVEQKHVYSWLHIKTDNLKSLANKRCTVQSTWETCGFGTLSCRACQQCW